MTSLASLRGMVARNWTLKLSALGIAVLLWFSVRFETRNQQEISSVAVRVDLTDPTWTLADGANPERVAVRFRGPALDLLRLSSDRPVVVVPISEVGSADTTLVLQPGWVRFGERPGVTVEAITPGTLTLRFEPVQRVVLAPALRYSGELPDDLALAAPPEATVREFRVAGPRSLMADLDSIPIVPVDLGEVRQSGAVPARVDTARISRVDVQPTALEISFQVEAREERTFQLPAPPFPSPPGIEGIEGYPDSVTVTVSGAASLVRDLAPGALTVVAELPDDLDPDEDVFEVSFRLEGLPTLLRGRVEPVQVRREEP
jgi:YbbR domain-containing protein